MEHLNNFTRAVLLSMLFLMGCGVKGRPLPPLNPPPLGRGESTYSSSKNKQPVKNKYDASQEGSHSGEEEK
jgi:hypothetical protein